MPGPVFTFSPNRPLSDSYRTAQTSADTALMTVEGRAAQPDAYRSPGAHSSCELACHGILFC